MDLHDLQRNLNSYLAAVRIETDGPPCPFSEVADPWQQADVGAIAPALEMLIAKASNPHAVRRCWWVRPRGHAKTADVAMLITWVLAFSRRRRRGVWVAADKQQGCEGLDGIGTLCRHNPWLDDILVVRGDRVENKHTGSVMYFTTSDVLSAFGWKDCDLFVMDEVTHWGPKGEELWAAIYSAAGKRKNAVVFALMNAGMLDTWQRGLRDKAEADTQWAFSELPDAIATWISEEQLADQAKYLPKVHFERLWRNWWSTGGGDALTREQVEAAFDPRMHPMPSRVPGYLFVAGVDLGLTRDFASVLTLAYPDRQSQRRFERIRLADAKLWRPPKGGKIDLMAIERYILDLDDRFRLDHVALDPWQAELMGQRLEADTTHAQRRDRFRKRYEPWVQAIPPTGSNLRDQASLVIESFTDGNLRLYPYPPLRSDLLRVQVEEKSYGYRLTSPKDAATGHGDSFSAFANALLVAHVAASKTRFLIGSTGGDEDGRPGWMHRHEAMAREIQEENIAMANEVAVDPFNRALYHTSGGARGTS